MAVQVRPPNTSFIADYRSMSLNADFSLQALVPTTVIGSPTLVNDNLWIRFGDAVYYEYPNDGTEPTPIFTQYVQFRPGYTGPPTGGNYWIMSTYSTGAPELRNASVLLIGAGTGNVIWVGLTSAGGFGAVVNFGPFLPVVGVVQSMTLQVDYTGGSVSLFVNGVQQGVTTAFTPFARSADSDFLTHGPNLQNNFLYMVMNQTNQITAPSEFPILRDNTIQPDCDTCCVYGFLCDETGAIVVSGKVRFIRAGDTEYVSLTGALVSTDSVTATINPDGLFQAVLPRGLTVKVEIACGGKVIRKSASTGLKLEFTVPDQDQVDITDLLV